MHHLLFSQVNLSTEEFQKITLLAHFEGIYTINHFFTRFLWYLLAQKYANLFEQVIKISWMNFQSSCGAWIIFVIPHAIYRKLSVKIWQPWYISIF